MFCKNFVSQRITTETHQTVSAIYLMCLCKLTISIRWDVQMTNFRLVDNRFCFSWIFFMLSGCILFTEHSWLSDWWQSQAMQLWLSVLSLQTALCISSFSCFSLSPPTPFRPIPPQVSPVPSVDAQLPLSISHASHEYLCVPVKNSSWNHGTGRLIHLVTWSQLAQTYSCTGTSAAAWGGI